MTERLKEKQTDAWFRELQNGRIEMMCRAENYRLRVTAPEPQAWEAIEMFERWTGLTVESERRPRRRPVQMPGQLSMVELELDDNGAAR
jgi:hypothetical protein